MVLKSTSTRVNGGIKTDRSDVHAGIESSNELNGREKNSFFGFLENILERVLKYSKDRNGEPEQDSEAKKIGEFMSSQYRMLNSIENLDEVISKRKEYGLAITPAAQDYLDFVQGVDGATDAWELSHRAAFSLQDQIEAEDKDNDNLLDSLYDEGKLSAFHDEEKNTKELYGDMTQEEYNAWRAKAADETREFMNKMDKKLADNPDYRPDTLNSVLEYRLYQVFKNSNIDNLRENLENQFYGELVGNNLAIKDGGLFPVSNFANFQNGLITAGLLTPKDDFISKYEAGYDLYQQNFEKYNDLKQNEHLASEIAKDKELLREGKFDELLKKDHGKVLNEEIKRLQTLKTNSTLNERNKKIYEDRLNSALRNFSELAIINFYEGDVNKVEGIANTSAYDGLVREIRTSLSSLGSQVGKLKYNEVADDNSGFDNLDEYELGKLNMQIEDFKTKIDNFIDFRKEEGLSELEGIISPDKTLSEILDDIKSVAYYEKHYGVSDIERGEKVDNAFKNLFMQDVVNSDYSRFTFEKLNFDFDKLYKETNKQKDLRIADKKALDFFRGYNIIDCFVDRNFNGETQLGRLYLNNSSDKEAQDYKLKNTNFVFKYNPENTYNNYSLTIDAPSISLTGGRYYMPDTNSTNERVIKNDGHIEIKNINAFIEGSLEVNSNGSLLSIKNKNPEDRFVVQKDKENDDPNQKVLTSINTNGDVVINGKTTLVAVNSIYGKDGVSLKNADIENSDVSTEQNGTFSIANTLVMNSYVEGVHSDNGAPTLYNFVSRNLDVKNISFINLTAQENDEKIISLTSEALNKKVSIENCLFDLAKDNQHRIRFTDTSDSKNESINNCTFNGKTKLEVKDANLSNSIFTNVKGSIENVPAGIYECDLKENIVIKNQKEKLENSSFENVKVSNVSDLSGVKVFNFEGKDSKYQESTTPEKKQDHGLAIDK